MNYLSIFTTGNQLGHAIAALILVSLIILSGVASWLISLLVARNYHFDEPEPWGDVPAVPRAFHADRNSDG